MLWWIGIVQCNMIRVLLRAKQPRAVLLQDVRHIALVLGESANQESESRDLEPLHGVCNLPLIDISQIDEEQDPTRGNNGVPAKRSSLLRNG